MPPLEAAPLPKKNYTRLGLLLDSDPAAAAAEIAAMLERTKGNSSEAARLFGIGYRTLHRYIERLRVEGIVVRARGLKNQSALDALVKSKPTAAAKKIASALKKAGGDANLAAQALGISWRTLHRCRKQLETLPQPP